MASSFIEALLGMIGGGSSGGFEYQRGSPGSTMGGWQNATGEAGVGAGLQGMWWGSDINALKHAGKDLRATAMQWVPQLLESTPEAQQLFDEDEFLSMVTPQLEASIGQMMGGYRTSTENIRRGLASRGLSASGLSQGIGAEASGQMMAQAASMRNQTLASARMNRLQQALQYRKDIVGLGLGVPTPAHQLPKQQEGSPWGQLAGSAAGGLLGSFTGGVGSGLADLLF